MEIERKHLLFKHPCNVLVSGPTGSGKTHRLRNILAKKGLFFNLNKEKINVLWAYGQWQPILDVSISDHLNVKYLTSIPTEKELLSFKPDILVLDDFMYEMQKCKDFETLFIKKGHHMNISIFFLVQNPHYHDKKMRTITMNCHYMIYTQNVRDNTQINIIAKQTGFKILPEAYKDAIKNPFGYIRLDLTPDTPEHLRIITNVEKIPIIYASKVIKEELVDKTKNGKNEQKPA